jgi:hypothetical protein
LFPDTIRLSSLLNTTNQVPHRFKPAFSHHIPKMPFLVFSSITCLRLDRLCGLVVRVLGNRSGDPGSIPDTTRKKKLWVWNGVHSASWV